MLAQDFSGFELLVVDQTTYHKPATTDYLMNQKDPRFHYYRVAPPSLPAARNFALGKAHGEVVIFIDDDIELRAGFIQYHYEAYKDESVGAVAGRVSVPGVPKSTQLLIIDSGGIDHGSFDYDYDGWSQFVQGANMSFRTSALKEIGGFDTSYAGNAHREESDVAIRFTKKGYKIAYRSKAVLVHFKAPAGGVAAMMQGQRKDVRDRSMMYQNESLFFLKHWPKWLLPYFVAKQMRFFVFNRELLLSGRTPDRLVIFLRGLWAGIKIYLRPPKPFEAKEVA